MPWQPAAGWIDGRLREFVLAPWQRGAQDERFWASLKAVGELAHAGDWLSRTVDPIRGRRWLDHACREVRDGELLRAVLARDPRFLPAVLVVVPFHLAGRGDPATVDVVRAQLPHATLSDLEWTFVAPALEILGVAHDRGRRGLAAGPGADAAYVLAHECFYATRWGHGRAADEDRAYAARTLPAMIASARSNVDLLAELVLAACCMEVPIDAGTLEMLDAAQASDGSITPPSHVSTRLPRFAHPTMQRTYHTTLAAIMAWAAAMMRP